MWILKSSVILMILVMLGLAACGGGGNNSSGVNNPVIPTQPERLGLRADRNAVLTVTGSADAGATVTITFPDGSQKTGDVGQDGRFSVSSDQPQVFYAPVVVVSTNSAGRSAVATLESKTVLKTLYQATGILPELPFTPSLGVNTEAPQGGAVTAGNPMPFVDIFRTARPFAEFNQKRNDQGLFVEANTVFDANGWPQELDPDLGYAKTKLLQGTLKGAIPDGEYAVLYEGNGVLEFSGGAIESYTRVSGENKYILNIKLSDFDGENEAQASETNAINMNVRNISPASYIKNIRIVMPGGTCVDNTGKHNPFIAVQSASTCPEGSNYESFESRLQADRNTIIFNPDYLLFLRNFKVVRMMNLMEASLKDLCQTPATCPAEVGLWENRATLSDAVWGGNDGETPPEKHKGVPVEVVIALANTLKRDIWINVPHIASDEYVTQLARLLSAGLDPLIGVYIEYSNEVWNSGFAAYEYMTAKGIALGLDSIPPEYQGSNRDAGYFARLRYHSQRSVEIFNIFTQQFGGHSRLVRVLGSFIGDKVLTQEMLNHVSANDVDALAIAPYFFGCPRKMICPSAGMSLAEAMTVDDVFDVIDQSRAVDVKSLDGTLKAVEDQLDILKPYNLSLLTYEGGQHLVTGVLGDTVGESDKVRLRRLFNAANRDVRMKVRYIRLLEAWKNLSSEGTSLFTLYTMPQAYYRFGNFGLKEHLNKPRSESPKFDAVMQFQEQVGNCWWPNC